MFWHRGSGVNGTSGGNFKTLILVRGAPACQGDWPFEPVSSIIERPFAHVQQAPMSMSSADDPSTESVEFSGRVRLFPLPNLVLFPHVMQPLHVFEPRYRCLLEDSLASDRLIAMALLAPGWENDYEGRPPLYPMACLGRVTSFHRLDDGTYNLLLLGLHRVRLVHREHLTCGSS